MAAELVGSEGVPGRRVLRSFVADAVAVAPGAELVWALVGLMGRELSAREWVEVTVAWKKLEGLAAAGRLAAVAEVDRALAGDRDAPGRPGRTDSTRPAADELAAALNVAPRAASTMVALARRVEADLPAAVDALAAGGWT